MAEKIVITSGKGGVGKTTVTVNLGYNLTKLGARVILADMDFGLNNLDVVAGIEDKITFDLSDVLNGNCRLKQALVESPLSPNLFVLPASHSLITAGGSGQQIKNIFEQVSLNFDYILLDCPAGIDVGFHRAVSCSNSAIVVTTPHLASIRDADKVLSILKSYKLNSVRTIINRIRGDLVLNKSMFSAEDIENTLNANVCGIIPEQDDVMDGIVTNESSSSYKAFKILAKNIKDNTDKKLDYLKAYSGVIGSIKKEIRKHL